MSTLVEQLLHYIAIGIPCIPLQPRGKVPLTIPELGFVEGLRSATTDSATLLKSIERYPEANIGLVPPPGVLVLDVDRPAVLPTLLILSPELAQAPRAVTGSGGFHLWLKAPAGVPTDSLRGRILEAVDLRGLGKSYLVAPPSKHPNGRDYRWDKPLRDLESLPSPSAQLIRMMRRSAPAPQPAGPVALEVGRGRSRERAYALAELRGRCEAMALTPSGQRHNELVRHAVALWAWVRAGSLSEAEVRENLGRAARASGLPEEEIDKLWRWVRQTTPTRTLDKL